MSRAIFGLAAAALMLGSCARSDNGDRDNAATANVAQSAGGPDYVAAIRAMEPKLRRATFLRAVRDAQQPCQEVVAEAEGKPVNDQTSWVAQCEDGSGYVIAVQPDGNAKVMNALKPTPINR